MSGGRGPAALLVAALLATGACGGDPAPRGASEPYGRLSVDPPAGVLPVEEGETLVCRLRFEAGEEPWPPGARLLVYPPATMAPRAPESLPAELDGGAYELVREAYRAVSVSWPGRSGRYVIRPAAQDGRAGREPFELRFDTIAPRHYYGRGGACGVSLRAELVGAEGRLLHEFPMPRWSRAAEPPARLRCLLPSEAVAGRPVTVRVSVGSWHDNPVLEAAGTAVLEAPQGVRLAAERLELRAGGGGVATTEATFPRPGVYRLRATLAREAAPELVAFGNPIVVRAEPDDRGVLLWGDLHNHSVYSFDTRTKTAVDLTPREVIAEARHRFGLDFIALTDHAQTIPPVGGPRDRPRAFDMPREDWQRYRREILGAPTPGIVAFLGFEQNDRRGHCVLINRLDGPFFVHKGFRVTHDRYWRMKRGRDLLSIPHLHPLRGIDSFVETSPVETLVEIYSQHGAYETYLNEPYEPRDNFNFGRGPAAKHDQAERGPFVRELLDRGLRYGFVACSDHANAGSMGLTAVRAASGGRDDVFDALAARRTWATTGARLWLDFQVQGVEAGAERVVPPDGPAARERTVRAVVHAVRPIALLQVIRNGEVWREVRDPDTHDLEIEWTDDAPLAQIIRERVVGAPSAYYYLRVVQIDDHVAWSSPVFLEAGG